MNTTPFAIQQSPSALGLRPARDLATCIEALVDNAIAAGARNVHVTLKLGSSAGREVRIVDDGAGIRQPDRFPNPTSETFIRTARALCTPGDGGVRISTTNRHGRTKTNFNPHTLSHVGMVCEPTQARVAGDGGPLSFTTRSKQPLTLGTDLTFTHVPLNMTISDDEERDLVARLRTSERARTAAVTPRISIERVT